MRSFLTALDVTRDLLMLLAPIVAGMATEPVVNLLRRLSGALDRAPSWIKQAIVLAVATALTAVERAVGASLGLDLFGATPAEVQAFIAALIAHVLHRGKAHDARRRIEAEAEDVPPGDEFKLPS
jgi:predicted Na+-dependent transporter